ncbi:MAG: sigma-54 dependent transcriptional regulator [Myxococcota bacterium]
MSRRNSPPPKAPATARILIVDDSEGIRGFLASLLELRGYQVDTADSGRAALALLDSGASPDAILLDVMMPGIDGLETLRQIRQRDADVPVIMLSVVGRASTIVDAMQAGATDYLNKPFEEEELVVTLRQVLEMVRLSAERDELVQSLDDPAGGAIWQGAAMQKIWGIIEQIRDTDVTVLIHGESGVGKEIVARTVHANSSRAAKPFVKVNCAALPNDLLESELFGYEKGAFTGAVARKSGKFEVAHEGTIFLDEIGEMSPALQAKLLQVLQDAEFTHLGGNREIRVDVRVVCATNRDLEQMVKEGGFREDLYFRLNVVNVAIPPLRERRSEIPALVDLFLRRYGTKYGRPRRSITPALSRLLGRHTFPGNVRELENMIKRIVVLESENSIIEELLSGGGYRAARAASAFETLLDEIEETAGTLPLREVGRRAAMEAERETIERVLHRTSWNRKQAARILGVSYKTLLQKIRECGLTES